MPFRKHIHIAILDTDLPVPTIYAHRGLYSTQFRHLLRAAAATINPAYELHTTAFDVVGGHLPAYASLSQHSSTSTPRATSTHTAAAEDTTLNPLSIPITAILITGSSAAAYDSTKPWIPPLITFLQTVHSQYQGVRLFGSCFGHQILARALLELHTAGQQPYVSVEPAPHGKEVGLKSVVLTPEFTGAFPGAFPHRQNIQLDEQGAKGTEGRWEWNIQMIHGDHVRVCRPLPAGWCVVGASEECAVQGLYDPGRVLTYQGHFEFDAEVNRETCVEFGRREGWKAEDVERWVQAIGADDEGSDAVGAAEVVVRFFAGEDDHHGDGAALLGGGVGVLGVGDGSGAGKYGEEKTGWGWNWLKLLRWKDD
ncbi:hypothetical protein ASPACDRAFT_1854222 [Aspergillus aculeatus ATCC 16872]|uniref:Glutamine amidotransferase domain-containing protein n=1 Tax=Aspergillus aculeatus (strain ATCC 16872 / CBS 172.66 / WB 5094) TaxID=690307 RepID=A0A1L9X1J3_ASPA1|nr:uncharacterized protein ASPACDRAFT_1854222 [Aspergillus aculeatus ATCC 16872]OJK02236.1 hypothetical protein ASPACDRAFT_1854222 [Aspergillus aculeatus ATCC 16872]